MTTHHKDRGIESARCSKCDHDLTVMPGSVTNGAIHCSNRRCKFSRDPHPTTNEVNRGKVAR